MAFLRPDGTLDRAGLAEAFRLVTRHAVRLTLPPLPDALAAWRAVREQDRLIGVSFTGFGDLTDALGYAPYDLLAEMRRVVHAEADRYADQLGIARPRLKTTVKPEGTLSQLPGVSSGLHPSFAPHYLRRVRIGQADAVAQALRALGLEPKPEAGYADLEAAPTWVYEFPVRSPAPRPAYAYSAVEQLERYRHVARVWADHNPSVTVYLAPEEREAVADWLLAHWDEYVAVSFLPKTAHAYPLMPYEAISEAEYRARAAALPNLDRLPEVVDALEGGTLRATDDLEAGCAGGACPVR